MVYHIKLTVESKEEKDVPSLTNDLFKQLKKAGLTVTGVAISNGAPPTAEDELILEQGLQDEEASPAQEQGSGNTSGSVVMAPATKPASQIQPGSNQEPGGWSTKPSSLTDDGTNKTWDFGTKWI